MTKIKSRWGLAVAGAAMVAGLTGAGPASAAPASDSYCVASVGSEVPLTCFATFAKALNFASGGELVTGGKNAAQSLRDPAFHAQVNAVNDAADLKVRSAARAAAVVWTVISIEFDNLSQVAPGLIYRGSSGNCSGPTGNTDYATPAMPAGWNNRIESFYSYANCWVRHFESTNYGGAASALTSSRTSLGILNNQTSSIEWT